MQFQAPGQDDGHRGRRGKEGSSVHGPVQKDGERKRSRDPEKKKNRRSVTPSAIVRPRESEDVRSGDREYPDLCDASPLRDEPRGGRDAAGHQCGDGRGNERAARPQPWREKGRGGEAPSGEAQSDERFRENENPAVEAEQDRVGGGVREETLAVETPGPRLIAGQNEDRKDE